MNAEQRLGVIGALLAAPAPAESGMAGVSGQQIVVLDRGWVYVGDVSVAGDMVTISNARCLRKWGTKRGLGELVNGPLPETVMDVAGTVRAPVRAVIHFIACRGF